METVGGFQILLGALATFWPVWLALAIVLGASFLYRQKLGLYGQLFESGVGIVGVGICFFWLFTAIFSSQIAPFNPLAQIAVMKDSLPGTIEPSSGQVYLFGGDKLARDVFSRMVFGSRIVLIIAPTATAFALMVGITLGLPAGYYGGRIDSILSFLANLVLAFPVILTGIRIVLVQNIGLATIAALIGGGGFGVFVFQGIGQTAMDLVLLGTVPTVLLGFAAAITLDALIDSNLFSAGGRQKA